VRVLGIARIELVRLFRDSSNLFFVLVLPLLLIVLIGVQFGGPPRIEVGVVAPRGEVTERIVAAIDAADRLETVDVASVGELADEVRRARLSAGVVVPQDADAAMARGEPVAVEVVMGPDGAAPSARAVVEAAVAELDAVVSAARHVAAATARPAGPLMDVAAGLQEELPGVTVAASQVGEDELAEAFAGLGQFDRGASSQLFLFVFLTSLASGSALILTRQYGVARRMLATPTGVGEILLGQAMGRLLVALVQAAYIIVVTLLLFRVDWGDPVATAAVVVLFALVAAGAGMLLGSVLDNDSQASGAGVGAGLVLAALGGSMVPIELFPSGVRTVAAVTPHRWANEAMAEIVRDDAGVLDVAAQLGVLAAMAVVALTVATVALRRALTR
jgi:ABC-2 type transport system permease protein